MDSHWAGAFLGIIILITSFVIYFCLLESVRFLTTVYYGHSVIPLQHETSYKRIDSNEKKYKNTDGAETETITDDP